jgi:hypothetical protein
MTQAWQLLLPCTIIALTGFGLVRYFGVRWDSVAVFFSLQFIAVCTLIFLGVKSWIEAGLLKDIKPEIQKEVKPEEPRKIENLNPVFSQSVPQVRFNKVARFATTLLSMQAFGNVDLREPTWKQHFGSRENYVNVRNRFENAGAFVRKTTANNSPFVVNGDGGWYVVGRVAAGDESVLN